MTSLDGLKDSLKINFDDKIKDALLPMDTKCPHFNLLSKTSENWDTMEDLS